MSHDSEAAFASSEIADIILHNQDTVFSGMGTAGAWSVSAMREGGHQWPLTDGVILAENTTVPQVKIAFEYKRLNEGVHGILTALGQSFAYLEKGYDATIMVIPEQYSSHTTPGQHIARVIETTSNNSPIGVYTYSAPNLAATRPFQDRLTCVRNVVLANCRRNCEHNAATTGSVSTLWAHMREGMSHPDAFFRYCQSVKIITAIGENLDNINIPPMLIEAIHRINRNADPIKYLSCTIGDTLSDRAWRQTWFNFYFWNDLMPIYNQVHPYIVNSQTTRIRMDDAGNCQGLFSGRRDSIKEKLTNLLNHSDINEETAWERYATKVHSDAHSYREVIDSGLYHIGFLAADGGLTELGYKFVDACERFNTPCSGIPFEILRAAILQNGQYGAMLHYFYKLSEEKFNNNLFEFAESNQQGVYRFNAQAYLSWLDDIFYNQLHLSRRSTLRAGGTRHPFQAEISFLKKLGFVKSNGRNASYRVGLGLEIDWPQVQSSMLFFQGL